MLSHACDSSFTLKMLTLYKFKTALYKLDSLFYSGIFAAKTLYKSKNIFVKLAPQLYISWKTALYKLKTWYSIFFLNFRNWEIMQKHKVSTPPNAPPPGTPPLFEVLWTKFTVYLQLKIKKNSAKTSLYAFLKRWRISRSPPGIWPVPGGEFSNGLNRGE